RMDNARRRQIIDLVLPMSGHDGVQCAAGQAYGSTALSLQVSTTEARRPQFRMPASCPESSAFYRLSAIGRMVRSTALLSSSMRPSPRNSSSPVQHMAMQLSASPSGPSWSCRRSYLCGGPVPIAVGAQPGGHRGLTPDIGLDGTSRISRTPSFAIGGAARLLSINLREIGRAHVLTP